VGWRQGGGRGRKDCQGPKQQESILWNSFGRNLRGEHQ
jgi:hypothetical protein